MTITTALTIIAGVIGAYYIISDIKRIYELKVLIKEMEKLNN